MERFYNFMEFIISYSILAIPTIILLAILGKIFYVFYNAYNRLARVSDVVLYGGDISGGHFILSNASSADMSK